MNCYYFLGKDTIDKYMYDVIQTKKNIANGVTGTDDQVEENMVNLAIRLSVALICAPRFGFAFVWLAVPAGWLANFLISYAALRKSWPRIEEDKGAIS